MSSTRLAILSSIGLFALAGCALDVSNGAAPSEDQSSIIGGKTASAYPEAALIDMYKNGSLYAYCSGSVIAPKVVLTAGHCVAGFTSWKITAPFAGTQSATAKTATTYDWQDDGTENVNPKLHDIGLIFLDTAIAISPTAVLAQSPLSDGSKAVNIGRIQNGSLSKTSLFVSSPLSVNAGSSVGYPYDYYSKDVIESGDSGGPVVTSGSSPHQIVAVNSGGGTKSQVLARVDFLYGWIDQQVQAHGGWASGSAGTGGSTGAGGSTAVGGSTGSGGSTSGAATCAHDICASGTRLTSGCNPCVSAICTKDSYCCKTAWDATCTSEVASICGQSCGGGGTTNTCSHAVCAAGATLIAACDPCVTTICAADSYCCSTSWDKVCVGEVSSLCAQACN